MSTVARSALSQVPSSFPPFKLEDKLAKIEAEFCQPKDANTLPHKTDHLKPRDLQMTQMGQKVSKCYLQILFMVRMGSI